MVRSRPLPIVLVLVALGAGAFASTAQALTGCGGNEPSAVMQYCESIPNANGGSPVPPGGAAAAPLLFSLPPSAAKAMLRSRKHSRLLTIPGPYRHTPASGAPRAVSGFDLLRTLILIVVAVGLALGALAAWRRRRVPAAA